MQQNNVALIIILYVFLSPNERISNIKIINDHFSLLTMSICFHKRFFIIMCYCIINMYLYVHIHILFRPFNNLQKKKNSFQYY